MTPSLPANQPKVLYTVSLAWWMRLLTICVAVVIMLTVGLPVLFGILEGDERIVPIAWIVAPLLIVIPTMTILGNLHRFTVTTDGILIRGWFRTFRIPWKDVAVVEVDRSFMGRGATVVVTYEGRRVRSELTAARYAIRRGESTFDHGRGLLEPARPTREAIQAHKKYLQHQSQHRRIT